MVKRFTRGIEDYGTPFASEILKDYDKKEELLSHKSTLKYFKKELLLPSPIIDRKPREMWKKSGSKSTRKRAKEQAEKLAEKSSIVPIDTGLKKELDQIPSRWL